MSKKELDRHDIIRQLLRREFNGTRASQLLNISTRQIRRLKVRVKQHGAPGLVHGNRGKPSNHRTDEEMRQKITKLLHRHYADFGPTLATEKLLERHQIKKDVTTIRSIMITEGLWKSKKKRNGEEHRAWRQRKAAFGEMQQFDGSYEYWFEDRGPYCCLLAAIDDATGRVTKAFFAPHEGVMPVFTFWKGYLLQNGKPRSIYLDKFSTYKMNQRVAVENHDILTQFQRAMRELGIEPISAHSPEAKGRVERLFRTLQDRLIKELRLRKISNVVDADRFLEREFIAKFNQQFSVVPASAENLHRPLSAKEKTDLNSIFSRQETRIVQNDFTLSFKKQWCQLIKDQPVTVCKKDVVIIEERLDDSVFIRLRGKYLNYQILPERPKKVSQVPWVLQKHAAMQPAPDHPWRLDAKAAYLKKMQKSAIQN